MSNPDLIDVMADSHDNKLGVLAAIRLFKDRQIGLRLHAGDYIAPFNAGLDGGSRCFPDRRLWKQ